MDQTASKVLTAFRQLVAKQIPGFLNGFYVYGSLALSDYIPGKSDIDFVAISEQRANQSQIRSLARIHREIRKEFPKSNLSGIYVCPDDLGKSKLQVSPFPYFTNGRMHREGYFEMNEVTWWELKHKSICLVGEPKTQLQFGLGVKSLKKSVTLNMLNYWDSWIKLHAKIWAPPSWLLSVFPSMVEWGALTVSRQYFTLRKGDVTSKTRAGKFCMREFPSDYHPFLGEVLDNRDRAAPTLLLDLSRSRVAIDYMSFVISECRRRELFEF